MIRIAVLGDIGSGKSYVAKQFGYPVFNAPKPPSAKIIDEVTPPAPSIKAFFPFLTSEIIPSILVSFSCFLS